MVEALEQKLSKAVDEAIRRICSAEHFRGGSLARLPVLYPSGASVVIQVIEPTRDRCFVTDMGLGYQEADMMGAGLYYSRQAQIIADDAGVRFDNRAFFIAEVSRDLLPGAVVTIANCSHKAVSWAAYRLAERKEAEDKDALYERLRLAFAGEAVQLEKDAEIAGASAHKWRVSVLAMGRGSSTIFEAVSAHYVSVVGTAAKFNDIARLDLPPPRIAVVKSKVALGDYLGVLAPTTSSVVELTASNDTFRRLRAA